MSTTPQDSLTQLPHKVREAAGDFRSNWAQWRRDVAANPAILFQSLPVRIGFWLLVAVAFYFAVSRIMNALSPSASAGREEPTHVATIYVACAKPDCGRSKLANPTMDFKDWPMKCDFCGGSSAYRATQCGKCREWNALVPGRALDCAHCRRAAEATKPATRPAGKQPEDPDDREDGWGG
jgi:hypothetical protein